MIQGFWSVAAHRRAITLSAYPGCLRPVMVIRSWIVATTESFVQAAYSFIMKHPSRT